MGKFRSLKSFLLGSASTIELGRIAVVVTGLAGAAIFTSMPARAGGWGHGPSLSQGGKILDQARTDAGNGAKAVGTVVENVGKTGQIALRDAANTWEKALHDTGKTVEIAGQDMGAAVVAVEKYVEREVQGMGTTLDDAAKRVREGKIVDAIWHASTDPLKHTEENAAKAAQESNILRTVGQLAATVYGGPGGTAAFAAWYAYNASGGDVEFALRAGVIAGATSAALGAAGKMPADQLAQKVIVTGAIGGLGVAVAGGNAQAVQEGFLRAGGMVLLQAGYENVTRHPLDAHASSGDGYCLKTVGADCSAPPEAYVRDAKGNILRDAKGDPLVDVTKTDAFRPHVGMWSDSHGSPMFIGERSGLMTGISRVPGMNAMALFHDVWTDSWQMSTVPMVATIAPAIVLTYAATDAPYFDLVGRTALDSSRKQAGPRANPAP